MSRTAIVVLLGSLVAGVAVATLLVHDPGRQPGSARITRVQEHRRTAEFIARFDSLTDARLYPTVWRSGTFVKTSFDDSREAWTLTVSPEDWKRRNEISKKDLAATLFSALQGVVAQAGGDPDRAILEIESDKGEVLIRASRQSGIRVLE